MVLAVPVVVVVYAICRDRKRERVRVGADKTKSRRKNVAIKQCERMRLSGTLKPKSRDAADTPQPQLKPRN